MKTKFRTPLVITVFVAVALQPLLATPPGSLAQAAKKSQAADQAFARFTDRFFDGYFHFQPGRATQAGLHQYDTELPAYARRQIEAEIARSTRALAELERVRRNELSPDNQFDARLLESGIRAHLLDLKEIRMWEKDPNFYMELIGSALFVLVRRDFAPLDARLKSLVARERQVPTVLQSARENVSTPPAVYTDIATRQVSAEIDFLKSQLPQAVAGAHDAALKAEFGRVNQQAIDAYTKYLDYLKTDLAPRSHGSFAIGAENYRKKLLYDEMVDAPLDALLKIGERELGRTRADLKATSAMIDPSKSAAELLRQISQDHPDADHLIPVTQDVLSDLRQFLTAHPIITLLSPENPQVVETPPFLRALTFASMDTPGPFEKNSAAFYNITLPESEWSAAQKDEYLQGFNHYAQRVTSIHEVFPGHYAQFLWSKRVPSKVRKLSGVLHQPWGEVGSNGEGWRITPSR